MRLRQKNVLLLMVLLAALTLSISMLQAPAMAEGADPPPINRDTCDTTGGGTSIPDYPSGGAEESMMPATELTTWDLAVFALNAII